MFAPRSLAERLRPGTRLRRLPVPSRIALAILLVVVLGAVFAPLLTFTGVEGKMFSPMAITVMLALAGAFILSLTFVPAMVALLCSYFFDGEPVHLNDLYWREGDRTQQFWTHPYVPGKRYVGKEIYVLTSKRTFSGAEEFTYNLKNLKRATIVGETTVGGAHPGGTQRINAHFAVWVPSGRAINPITKTN